MAWSTAGVLQRELSVGTPTQLAGRAWFAFLALLAVVAVLNRGRTFDAFRSTGLAGLAVAVCTAIASGSFIVALNHANVAGPGSGGLVGVGSSLVMTLAFAIAIVSIGARLIPAAEVALITLLEVVLAPLWVWIAISERPAPTAIVGGAVVVVAVVLQTTQKTRSLVTPHPIAAPEAAR